MKIYLAGPMTGHKDHNFPMFDHVSEELRKLGHHVFNPADLTKEFYGSVHQFLGMPDEEQRVAVRSLLAKELSWICLNADAIFLLPGWENSFGARAEHEAALAVKIEVHFVPQKWLENLQVS